MKRRFLSVAIVAMFAGAVSACGPKVPASYSAQSQRASNATQLLQSLTALGQTAINLNALPSGAPGRFSDADTAIVRDASLIISDALTSYVSTGTGQALRDGYNGLMNRLSMDAKLSPTIRVALALVNTNIQVILGAQ